jgi:hypothetical protein
VASAPPKHVAYVLPLGILAMAVVVTAWHPEWPQEKPPVRFLDAGATEADIPEGDGSDIPADQVPVAEREWAEDPSAYAGEEGVDW